MGFMTDVTQILSQIEHGAAEQLLALVYDELRKLSVARIDWSQLPSRTRQ